MPINTLLDYVPKSGISIVSCVQQIPSEIWHGAYARSCCEDPESAADRLRRCRTFYRPAATFMGNGLRGFSITKQRTGCDNYYAFVGFVTCFNLAGLPRTPAIETETPTCNASALILAMASCLRRSVLVLISSCAQVITCESSTSDSALTVS